MPEQIKIKGYINGSMQITFETNNMAEFSILEGSGIIKLPSDIVEIYVSKGKKINTSLNGTMVRVSINHNHFDLSTLGVSMDPLPLEISFPEGGNIEFNTMTREINVTGVDCNIKLKKLDIRISNEC